MKRIVVAALMLMLVGAFAGPSYAQDQPMSKAEKRQLFADGARMWPVYCSQCHNARPGSEFAPYQWNMIMMHMRTQANLPAKNARAILEYLKAGR